MSIINEKIKKDYSMLLEYYHLLHDKYQTQGFPEKLKKEIEKIVVKKEKFLDFGCGPGIYTEMISKLFEKSVGIDICEEMISYCKKRFHNTYTNVNFKDFEDRDFNLIISISQVLNHIHSEEELDFIFGKFYSILSGNGVVIFDIYNSDYVKYNKYKKEKRILGKKLFYTIDPILSRDYDDNIFLRLNNKIYDNGTIKPYVLEYKIWKKEYIINLIIKHNFELVSIRDMSEFDKKSDNSSCKISFIIRKNTG